MARGVPANDGLTLEASRGYADGASYMGRPRREYKPADRYGCVSFALTFCCRAAFAASTELPANFALKLT